jgi:hypothetical protein
MHEPIVLAAIITALGGIIVALINSRGDKSSRKRHR